MPVLFKDENLGITIQADRLPELEGAIKAYHSIFQTDITAFDSAPPYIAANPFSDPGLEHLRVQAEQEPDCATANPQAIPNSPNVVNAHPQDRTGQTEPGQINLSDIPLGSGAQQWGHSIRDYPLHGASVTIPQTAINQHGHMVPPTAPSPEQIQDWCNSLAYTALHLYEETLTPNAYGRIYLSIASQLYNLLMQGNLQFGPHHLWRQPLSAQDLERSELYQQRMAAISSAALGSAPGQPGYQTETMDQAYVTQPFVEVCDLYTKYLIARNFLYKLGYEQVPSTGQWGHADPQPAEIELANTYEVVDHVQLESQVKYLRQELAKVTAERDGARQAMVLLSKQKVAAEDEVDLLKRQAKDSALHYQDLLGQFNQRGFELEALKKAQEKLNRKYQKKVFRPEVSHDEEQYAQFVALMLRQGWLEEMGTPVQTCELWLSQFVTGTKELADAKIKIASLESQLANPFKGLQE